MDKKFQRPIKGECINNWVVIEDYGIKNRIMHYHVECKCGNRSIKHATQLRKNKECFTCSRKRQSENGGTRRTHGACSSESSLYKTYQARHYMIKRCQGKTPKEKKNYLDRGITVCHRWLESFENFYADMGKKPENLSLDRIDNNKGYFKENCRWASIEQQSNNQRKNIYHTYENEKLTVSEWAHKWGITRSKAYEWLKRQGIEWVVKNIEKIKSCKTGMSNQDYVKFGLEKRKGHGQRVHSASRDSNHPLHKMYKSWDYMKHNPSGMCDEWSDFLKFVEDMGEKPQGKKLKRKFTNLCFDQENCYWG